MQYNGKILKPFSRTEPVMFNPPVEMLCWDVGDDEPVIRPVYYYNPSFKVGGVFSAGDGAFRNSGVANDFCAVIPEHAMPESDDDSQIVTNRELSHWLSSNYGEVKVMKLRYGVPTYMNVIIVTYWIYPPNAENHTVCCTMDNTCRFVCIGVREWGSDEWVMPTKKFIHRHDAASVKESPTEHASIKTPPVEYVSHGHYIILERKGNRIALGPIRNEKDAQEYLASVTAWKNANPHCELYRIYPVIGIMNGVTVDGDPISIYDNDRSIQGILGFGEYFPKLPKR